MVATVRTFLSHVWQALEVGSRCLLVDEDTAATNLMIRDKRMQVGVYVCIVSVFFFFFVLHPPHIISRYEVTLLFLVLYGRVHARFTITRSIVVVYTKNGLLPVF